MALGWILGYLLRSLFPSAFSPERDCHSTENSKYDEGHWGERREYYWMCWRFQKGLLRKWHLKLRVVFFFLIFIYLAVSGRSWGTWDLSSRQTDSLVVGWAQYLEHSCSAAYGILVLWPGIKLVSPALQGRFLTTGPPVCAQSLFCPWDFPVKNTGVGCYFLSRGSSHWTTKEGPKAES